MGSRRRRVTWTESAVRGLDSTISFVALDSVDHALRLLKRVLDAADSLGTLGERGSVVGTLHQRQDVQRWRDRRLR